MVEKEQKKAKRQKFIVRIGPELKKVLDEQLKSIREVTYGISDSSYWEAGEIIAKKMKNQI